MTKLIEEYVPTNDWRKEVTPVVESITLSESSVTLDVGGTAQIVATVLPAEAAAYYSVVWASDNAEVATVVDGLISYVGEGDCTITATAGGKSAEVAVVCEAPVVVESITLDQESVTVEDGTPVTVVATVLPEEAAAKFPVSWESDDETVATVDDGVITYVGDGECTVTATAGDKSAEVAVVCETPTPNYLCFTANEANSSVALSIEWEPTEVELEISTDGTTWEDYEIDYVIELANVGDKVYMRNKSEIPTGFNISNDAYYFFIMTGSIAASGDINYLLCKNSTNTLSDYCYFKLFYECTSLTQAPELPATTLAEWCYNRMFSGCTSLTAAPELPVTTLADGCYAGMFSGCTSLTQVPQLPATTLAESCYSGMFYECTSLTQVPELPATTLAESCYDNMFNGCSNINISETQTEEYPNEYRIPSEGTGVEATNWNSDMFVNTGGTFTSDPVINTTYYTSNTIV